MRSLDQANRMMEVHIEAKSNELRKRYNSSMTAPQNSNMIKELKWFFGQFVDGLDSLREQSADEAIADFFEYAKYLRKMDDEDGFDPVDDERALGIAHELGELSDDEQRNVLDDAIREMLKEQPPFAEQWNKMSVNSPE